ncbi:uncharacterized protein LOC110650636 [Hevea brasiliensis]|uniref:uncharacterized protein LOC110650636 n=1 Tax=Hevea brasiliensis TaxID=3981 RepID=UPI0025EADEE2|nr:uncharacterized protein LOC110650636 [Hevea brasiliensis]
MSDEESDYAPSDDLWTDSDLDKEGGVRYPDFNSERNMQDPTFKVGMRFKNKNEFKEACRTYGIKNRFQIHFPKNDHQRVLAKCYKSCGWKIYASKKNPKDSNDPTMQIKSANLTHNCGKDFSNFHVTSKWLAETYLETYRMDPHWSLSGLVQRVKEDWSLSINRMKAWRAREWAQKAINGNEQEQYGRLYDYREEILRTNLDTTFEFITDRGVFEGLYICLGPLKKAFNAGCRNLICLDGCWLKGTYGGQLLSVVTIDPNDCIFSIAYAVVKIENDQNRKWFLEHLKDDMQMHNSHS